MREDSLYDFVRSMRTMPQFVRVSALPDKDGKVPPLEPNPPVGSRLTKVVGSKPFPPKEEEKDPK